jgi:hypothetical protein
VGEVVFHRDAGNKQVIKVGVGEREATQHLIYKALEGLGGVAETERHAKELKKAKRSGDRGLRDV